MQTCLIGLCDGQDILIGAAKLTAPHTIKYNLPGRVDVGGEVTAKDIMLATGSVPFVPPGIPIDGKTVSPLCCLVILWLLSIRKGHGRDARIGPALSNGRVTA